MTRAVGTKTRDNNQRDITMSEQDLSSREPDDDALEERYRTFLSHNVRLPGHPLPDGDPSPARPPVTFADVIKGSGPDARESSGALLAPVMVPRHALDVTGNPGPCVHTSVAQEFIAAGPGETAAFRPRRSDRIPVSDSAAPEVDSGSLNPWAPKVGTP